MPYVVLVGRLTLVNVTGYGLGFEIVTTTSPAPPGYSCAVGEGVATLVMVRFCTVAA